MIEFIKRKPFKCPALKKLRQKKDGFKKYPKQKTIEIGCEYSFNITKADENFNQLFGTRQFKLFGRS